MSEVELQSLARGRTAAPEIRCAMMTPRPGIDPRAGVASLIALILDQYHEPHRREFPRALALAREVEALHAASPDCPRGLADLLARMFDHLESHQRREEQVLFPMILAGDDTLIRFPIRRMMAEHQDVETQLTELRVLTRDFSYPGEACRSWRELIALCRKLDSDLRDHMRIENEALFAPFMN